MVQAKPPYPVFGYLPDYHYSVNLSQLDWSAMTGVVEAFAEPNSDGTISFPDPQRASLISTAHGNGCRCILSFGGGGTGPTQPPNPQNPAYLDFQSIIGPNQSTFISNVMTLMSQGDSDGTNQGYDGVDIDWEFPQPVDETNFTSFMTNLALALHATKGYDGKPRQLSFYTGGTSSICGVNWTAVGGVVDYCVMGAYAYEVDQYNGPLNDTAASDYGDCFGHTRMATIINSVQTLYGLGFPIGKLLLGMPLNDSAGDSVDLVIDNGTFIAYDTLQAEARYTYGGNNVTVDTSQSFCDKINWALNQPTPLPGIALWEITQAPPSDPGSTAIWQVISGAAPCLAIPPTPTPTVTLTPTVTFTPTVTPTPTITLTPCPNCLTNTPTITIVSAPIVYPNPATGGNQVILQLPLTTTSDVKLQVFTLAYRKVEEQEFPKQSNLSQIPVLLKDTWGNNLANGLYYVVANTNQGQFIAKLLVLK